MISTAVPSFQPVPFLLLQPNPMHSVRLQCPPWTRSSFPLFPTLALHPPALSSSPQYHARIHSLRSLRQNLQAVGDDVQDLASG